MADEFSKQAGKAIQATVTGAAALVTGPAGVALAVGTAVTFNIFEALATRDDAALREFRVAALESEMIGVRDKMRALEAVLLTDGKTVDRQDPLTQNAVASEFVHGVTEARTAEKKAAIVNATVAQFDPRRGSPAFRDYWLRRVRELPEHELSILLLIADRGPLVFIGDETFVLGANPDDDNQLVALNLSAADRQAMFAVTHHMATRQEVGRLVSQLGESSTIRRNGTNYMVRPFLLAPDGKILVSFCKDE